MLYNFKILILLSIVSLPKDAKLFEGTTLTNNIFKLEFNNLYNLINLLLYLSLISFILPSLSWMLSANT